MNFHHKIQSKFNFPTHITFFLERINPNQNTLSISTLRDLLKSCLRFIQLLKLKKLENLVPFFLGGSIGIFLQIFLSQKCTFYHKNVTFYHKNELFITKMSLFIIKMYFLSQNCHFLSQKETFYHKNVTFYHKNVTFYHKNVIFITKM